MHGRAHFAIASAYAERYAPERTRMDRFTSLNAIMLAVSAVLLFMYGLEGFSRELQETGGASFKRWTERLTRGRVQGALLGAGLTALIQSSSAVSALAVALVDAGTLSFTGALPVLIGANVGTTITAWLVYFELTAIGPWLIVLGAAIGVLPWRIKLAGKPLFYFGFIIFALDLLSNALAPVKSHPLLVELLGGSSSLLGATLIGLLVTAVVQSSSVTTGLAILLVGQGSIAPEAAIAVVIGANVGTTSTALLAAARLGPTAKRLAFANVLFNVSGLVLFLPILHWFAPAVVRATSSPGRAVAWAHLGFNVVTSAIVLASLGPFVRLLDTLARRRGLSPSICFALLALGLSFAVPLRTRAQTLEPSAQPGDRVFVTNEDSNTLTVIDPMTNTVETTVNLTSFDEDPRPPFRFVTGGVMPGHAAMTSKPLYHGAIHVHGAAPSPDQTLIASTGRGSSNVYLIDARAMSVVGNRPNPRASAETNRDALSSGVLVGREPHEPTFSRNGKELWVALRGEERIAILDAEKARAVSSGSDETAIRAYLATLPGPSQVWFSRDGSRAFVISQKVPKIEVFATNVGREGYSSPSSLRTIDISDQDPFGFTPFQKLSPDAREMWFSHKLSDAVSSRAIDDPQELIDHVVIGGAARPNHIEFVENAKGKVVYVTLARIDDDGPGGIASSRIAIIDRSAPPGQRKVVGTFFSSGRESHGVWTNPANDRLYVCHEQDELPGTPHAGHGVVSVFDVNDPLAPRLVTRIPVGYLELPSGRLRSKKSINLVYVRPGSPTP